MRFVQFPLLLLLGLRVFMMVHLGFGDDEGYYWDWSRHLASGYFDHPPLTAWIIWLTQQVLPHAEWAVRLPFYLITLSGAWPFYHIARMRGAPRPLENTLYLFMLVPFTSLASFMVFPDVPMLAAWIWALYFSLRLENEDRITLWIGLGVALGCACLSKVTGGLLALSILIWALSSPARRRRWQTLGPWLAALLALLIFSPFLEWNVAQHFASIRFQLIDRQEAELRFSREFGFVALQFALVSPLGLILCFKALRGRWAFCFALPALLVFWLQPIKADFMIHWAAPAYLPLLAAVDWRSRGWRLNLGYLLFVNFAFAALCLYPILPVAEPRQDFSNDFYGWREAGPWIDNLAEDIHKETGHVPHLLTSRYQLAGNLSFYSGFAASAMGPRANAYRYFANYPQIMDDEYYLFIADNRYTQQPQDVGKFKMCKFMGTFPILRSGKLAREFKAWECEGFIEPR